MIKVTQAEYTVNPLNVLASPEQREIFNTEPLSTRTIPYERKISTSVTYEVDREKIFKTRGEPRLTDFMSDLGGYWSILLTLLILADFLDDV